MQQNIPVLSPRAWALLGLLKRGAESGTAVQVGETFALEYGELLSKALVVDVAGSARLTVAGETALHSRYMRKNE